MFGRTAVRRDASHPAVRREELVVRDVEEPDIGIRSVNLESVDDPKSYGIGFLCSDAHHEVKQSLDLEAYVGEHVATVYVDLDPWDYAIEWQVEVPLLQRFRRRLPGDRQ